MNLSKEQYKSLLSHLPGIGIILFNKNLDVLYFSDNLRYLDNLLPGFSVPRRLSGMDESEVKSIFLELAGKIFNNPNRSDDFEKEYSSLNFKAIPLENNMGKVEYGAIFFGSRSSDHRKSDSKLIREKEDAEKERDHAKRERKDAEQEKDTAEESSLLKSEFIASISHEIRTPLNAIIGFTEQLQKTDLDDKQNEYLKIIDKSAIYLLDLVNEILTFSKAESGEIKLDEVDFHLRSLIEDLYSTFNPRAANKKIKLQYEFDDQLDMILRGDELRLKQILTNLISNAIKFTEYGYVKVLVNKKFETKKDIWIMVEVMDTGMGIPDKKIRDIFTQFKQVNAGITRKHGGTGLGLTISKRLTELMEGRIWVKSTKGKGSVFTVEIPLKRSPVKSITENKVEIRKDVLSGYRVLIVDDDGLNRMLGKTILEGFNMQVDLAEDGQEALDYLRAKKKYDVILLDIHMPEMSGLDVARYIRNELNDNVVKIIAVTAEIIKGDKKRYHEAGINNYLIKPYREMNLYNIICKVMDLRIEEIKLDKSKINLQELRTVPVYDLTELRKVTRGDESFFYEMVHTFIQNAREGLDAIKEAHKQENWEAISEATHKMIPSYKHIEAKSVVADLIELKNYARESPGREELSVLIDNIWKETDDIIGLLNNEKP